MAGKEEAKQDDVFPVEHTAPAGWIKKFIPKRSGTPHKNDIVFISPSGEEIKSKRQLEQYLKSHPGGPPASEFDWGTGDTPRRSARLSEKSKAVEAPKSQSSNKKPKKSNTKNDPNEKNNVDPEGGPTNENYADTEGEAIINRVSVAEGEAIINKDTEEGKAIINEGADTEAKPTTDDDADSAEGEAAADVDADSAEKATNDKDDAAQEDTEEHVEASTLVVQDDGGDKEIATEKTELETESSPVKTPNETTTEIENANAKESNYETSNVLDSNIDKSKNVAESKDIVGEGNLKEQEEEEKPVENEPVLQEPTTEKAERTARLSSRYQRMARQLESAEPQPRHSSSLNDHIEVEMTDAYIPSPVPVQQVAHPHPPEEFDQDIPPTRNFVEVESSRRSKRRLSSRCDDSPPAHSPFENSRLPLNKAMLEQFEAIHLEDRRKTIQDPPTFDPTTPRFAPSWVISENESILHPSSDSVATRLQRGILFAQDKHEMMATDHHSVEDLTLEYLSKAALFVHHLSAKVSAQKQYLRDAQSELKKAEEAWQTLDNERSEIYDKRQNWAKKMAVLERRVETLMENRDKAIKDLAAAQQEQQSSYQRGYSAANEHVMSTFFASDEYKTILSKARVSGVRDFLKSTTFRDFLEGKKADNIMEGFYKAVDYMVQDGFVTQNFNVTSFEDHRLAAPPLTRSEVLEPTYEDIPEFYILGGNAETPISKDV